MTKPIIAVDIDDVLVPHFQDLIDWYNQEYKTQLVLADNHPTDTTNWGASNIEEAVRRVHRFYDTAAFRDAQPIMEAKAVLKEMASRYRLIIITARDTIIEEATRTWLDQHFKDFFEDVHFTARYSLTGKGRIKADVCREIGASYLIDDGLDNLVPALEIGTQGVLFANYPWSESEELPTGITRCLSWQAVKEYFDGQ